MTTRPGSPHPPTNRRWTDGPAAVGAPVHRVDPPAAGQSARRGPPVPGRTTRRRRVHPVGRTPGCAAWDEDFTAALAERGWLGMTVPVEYGGHGRTLPRTVRRHRGTARRRRPRRRALDRRPADRPVAAQVRHRGAEDRVPARGSRAGVLLRHRDERTGLGLRPGQRAHPRRPGRRRLAVDRHQGLDLGRPPARTRSSRWRAPNRSTQHTGMRA